MPRMMMRAMRAPTLLIAAGFAGAAICCLPSADAAGKSVLTIAGDNGGPFANNENPFSPSNGLGPVLTPMVYEGLFQFNLLKPEAVIPWLARSYSWSDGGRMLTMKIRPGVQWSDGKPFTAADVVFTFHLLTKFPALNLNGIGFESVTAPKPDTVVMKFAKPSYTRLYYIGTQFIVPEHVWGKIADPVHAQNSGPVGTGPYVVASFSPQNIIMKKNPHYWQKGKPAIDEIVYPDYTSNTTADLALQTGQAQWGGVFIAGLKRYTGARPGNEYFFPPVTDVVIFPNLERFPESDLNFRKAVSLAINRRDIAFASDLGEEAPITTPTALVLPYQKAFMPANYAHLEYKQDVAQARSLLKSAGYKWDAQGRLETPQGKPIDLGLIVSAPYSDNVAGAEVFAQELKSALGLQIHVVPEAISQWEGDLRTGNYDLGLRFSEVGPGPYYMFNGWMNSALTAKEGSPASSNYERFRDKAADALLARYADSASLDVQKQAMAGLEKIMIDQLPVIPIMYQTDWGEYETSEFTGWPSTANPYAIASTYDSPMNELVILNIQPKR